MGTLLVEPVLRSINQDINNTVFSFIPNTAEVAFYGLVEGIEKNLIKKKISDIQRLASDGKLTDESIEEILTRRVRREKVALKDIKLRTFIAEGSTREDLAAHVYDITYGSIAPGDKLVVIDDSIVRGTTLRQSILKILDRLNPGRIVVVSSSPQVRYPDCYGIDMSKLSEFAAFRAAMSLLEEREEHELMRSVYDRCIAQEKLPDEEVENYVKDIYAPFSGEEISERMALMLTPDCVRADVKLVFQTIEGLHQAIPYHPGDWYFTGNYPTPGGVRLVNKSFVNYYRQRWGR